MPPSSPRARLALLGTLLAALLAPSHADIAAVVEEPLKKCGVNCDQAFSEPNLQLCLKTAVTEARGRDKSGPAPTVVFEGDSDWQAAIQLNNLRFSGVVRPLAVFYAHSPDHVEAAVKCGRQWDVPISPAGGRHNYQGLALVTGGLTIDMSNLTKIEIDEEKGVVRVGTGVVGSMMATTLHERGPAGAVFPGGVCPWVGVAGYTLGGGISLLGRHLGLGCDQIISLQMVDAEGKTLTVSKSNHSDLLWASCGGGGGTFGIVTEFEFKLNILPDGGRVTRVRLPYAKGAAAIVEAFERFQDWMEAGMDSRFGAYLEWQYQSMTLSMIFIGPEDEARRQLKAAGLLDLPMQGNATIEELPSYWDWMYGSVKRYWLGAAAGPEGAVPKGANEREWLTTTMRGDPGFRIIPGGKHNQEWLMSQTRMPERLPRAAVEALAKFTDDIGALQSASPDDVEAPMFFEWFWVQGGPGSKISEPAPGDTAYAHRKAWYVLEGGIQSGSPAKGAVDSAEYISIVNAWLAILEPYLPASQPSYVNYQNPPQAGFEEAYWGDNAPRLAQIKAKYDPLNIFGKPGTVWPAPGFTAADA